MHRILGVDSLPTMPVGTLLTMVGTLLTMVDMLLPLLATNLDTVHQIQAGTVLQIQAGILLTTLVVTLPILT
jgi:hypothetical protein